MQLIHNSQPFFETTMETSALFNINRFKNLVLAGFFRKKTYGWKLYFISFLIVFILLAFASIMVELKTDANITLITQLYQILYMVMMTIPCLTLFLDPGKNQYWGMLPASTFEKRLYIFLKGIVWNSILFFLATNILNLIISANVSLVRIGPKEVFSIPSSPEFIKGWANHIISFLCLTVAPITLLALNTAKESLRRRLSSIYSFPCLLLLAIMGFSATAGLTFCLVALASLLMYFDFFIQPIIDIYRKS